MTSSRHKQNKHMLLGIRLTMLLVLPHAVIAQTATATLQPLTKSQAKQDMLQTRPQASLFRLTGHPLSQAGISTAIARHGRLNCCTDLSDLRPSTVWRILRWTKQRKSLRQHGVAHNHGG